MNENNKDILIKCFHAIEATSLNHTDNENVIKNFVDKINDLNQFHHISGICVYPNMVKIVKENIDSSIKIVAVAGGFPSSQTFLDIKMKEVELCIENGANEIDIVLSVGKYLNQEYEFVKKYLIIKQYITYHEYKTFTYRNSRYCNNSSRYFCVFRKWRTITE